MIRVKVCGMRDAFNIREISDALPDFMGFIFFRGSKRYIGDNPDPGLFSGIPSGIKKVGVFVDENNRRIIEIASMAGLTAVQLHGNESTESCNELKASGLTVIKTFNIGPDFRFNSLEPYSECCDFFLFDTKSETAGGSGKKFGWQRLEEYSLDKPFFLSGGIGPEDSITIRSLHNKGLFAADINSRFEISPGLKDVALVKAFINKIKEDSYDL
jgi:phosphoribosylanthranilate isomerase